MGSGHDHMNVSAAGRYRGRLMITIALMLTVLVLQAVGSAWSGSLALFADAGHTLIDILGVAMALGAVLWAARPAPASRTFGRFRVEVLAAGLNGLLLVGLGVFVAFEAWDRWGQPTTVRSGIMLWVALATLGINVIAALSLRRASRESLTMKGAYLEVLSDALGTAGVVIAAAVIMLTGWQGADVVASIVIVALIVPRAVRLLIEAWHILAEGAPRDLDLVDLRHRLTAVDNVTEVHDLHVWTITSGQPVLTAHVVVDIPIDDMRMHGRILDRLQHVARSEFSISHCTFQLELPGHRDHEDPGHP